MLLLRVYESNPITNAHLTWGYPIEHSRLTGQTYKRTERPENKN